MNKDYVTRNEFNSKMSKIDRYEVIYDKDGGSSLDWNMSGGLTFTGMSSQYFYDFSKYKRIFVSGNSRGTNFAQLVDLTTLNPKEQTYHAQIVYDSLYDTGTSKLWTMKIRTRLDSNKSYIEFRCINSTANGNDDRDAQVNKIIGWY